MISSCRSRAFWAMSSDLVRARSVSVPAKKDWLLGHVFWMAGYRAQPERDMGRLHRLLNHRNQVTRKRRQVHLAAQGSRKFGERADGIVLAAIEVTINGGLQATAQGPEESGDNEGRGDDGELRISGEAAKQSLECDDTDGVDKREGSGEGAIDEGTIEQDIYVEEPVAQHRDHDGGRDEKCGQIDDRQAEKGRDEYGGGAQAWYRDDDGQHEPNQR